jgi:type IV pilus assembly protein PilC
MAAFTYRAIDDQGRISSGELEALNGIDLELRLKRLGYDLITFEPVAGRSWLTSRRVSKPELINFCFHLEQMLTAGVPIIDALTDLRDSVDASEFKNVIAALLEDIEGGKTLSVAMANHPRAFDAVFVALVRAGETAGELPLALRELTENLKWQDEMAAQTKRALLYPTLVLIVVLSVTMVLLLWLVPTLAVTLKQLVPKLPRETEFLIWVSANMRQHWYAFFGVPIVLAALGLWLVNANEAARLRFDRIKLKLPIYGRLMSKIIMARFSTYFAMLYKSGISVLDGIHICERIVGNRVVASALGKVGRGINEGQSLTAAFSSAELFPPLVLRMMKVGESTGELDKALDNVSYFYNRDVRDEIGRLQTMIGPLTTIILGGMIGAIVLLMFLPIYDVITKIKL